MNSPVLTCQDDQRRQKVRDNKNKNGIDYVEVVDDHDQRKLCIHFFGKAPAQMAPANVRIEGGRRVRDIHVTSVTVEYADDPGVDDCLRVVVDKPGDFSTYRLGLVALDAHGQPTGKPFDGFDPRYASVDFSFKVGCPSDLDCKTEPACPPADRVEPEINYLAKDYASFRQLLLDRLALLMPDWQERHVPDLGITLVELLAYVGDYLSYYQDAVATEAYLDTARQRISVRRHARLVDYFMHEGCNARAWVCVETNADVQLPNPHDFYFITGYNDALASSGSVLSDDDVRKIPAGRYEVFEPLIDQDVQFRLRDFNTPAGLAVKLREAGDDVSKYLQGQFASETKQLLENYHDANPPPASLQRALLAELNRLLHSDSLYNQQRYAQVTLSADTRQLLAQNPQGEVLTQLNRLLLEDAYPDDLAKSGKIYLFAAHREMHFYTWGDEECCLPRGGTRATLREDEGEGKLHLQAGDMVIFEEVIGPKTGNPADADPAHRWAVCLTRVEHDKDPLCNQPIVEIEWAAEDALPFALCLSAMLPAPQCTLQPDISVARGNVILVDHGKTIDETIAGEVPTQETIGECACKGSVVDMTDVPGKFPLILKNASITSSQSVSFTSPASTRLRQDPRQALPQITLYSKPAALSEPSDPRQPMWQWHRQRDLLNSGADDQHFVAEMDNDGRAHVRFGDGELGRMPAANMTFTARYRVGNRQAGNVGAETISYIVTNVHGAHLRPRNPLPAQGGTDPEPMAEVKLFAPGAFRKDVQRAITADDYAQLAQRHPKVQRASGRLRWTGSWYEARVAIDPLGTEEASDTLLDDMTGDLHRYQRMGHDLVVTQAHYVPLDVELTICVRSDYQRGHVEAAALDVFSNGVLPNGKRAFFHPDNLTFGEGVYLSNLVAKAQAVRGVQSVTVTKLQRLQEAPNGEITNGILRLSSDEIAQLDNDPSFPEHGKLTLVMRGGR
jgi:hypothetical protein